jgi:hypothetical protein
VDTEDRPTRQLTQDEQPGSSCDAGEVRGPVGRPERRRDLEDEGGREQHSQAGVAGHGEAGDQECDPAADQDRRPHEHLATLPGVGRLTSTIVMKRIVDERPFPLAPPSPRPQPKG